MGFLPKSLHLFLYWWAVSVPKKIILITKRILIVVNNTLSFTVNIKLLFTPLFGDYTIIGRCIGFAVRTMEIIMGSIFMLLIVCIYPLLPVGWWILPIILLAKMRISFLLVVCITYVVWMLVTKNTPQKKVKNCDIKDFEKAFRPNTLQIYNKITDSYHLGISELLATKEIANLLIRSELNTQDFKDKLINCPAFNVKDLGPAIFEYAKTSGSSFIQNEHIFLALLKVIPKMDLILATYNSKIELVEGNTFWILSQKEELERRYIWQEDFDQMYLGGTGKGMTGHVTPYLDAMSEDLTKKAVQGGYQRFTARKSETKRLAELLSASSENILLIGDPGSGKTSVIKGVAFSIMKGTEYKSLKNKRIVSIELAGLISGTKSPGEIAEKLKLAMKDAKSSGDIILFIDEIHTLIEDKGGSSAELSIVFNLLEPELSAGNIQFIGATTKQNYRKYIEPNGAFARLFHLMEINEATNTETLEILKYVVAEQEYKKKILITYPALNKAIELSKKLMHERVLPDKAVQIIERAATIVEDKNKILSAETVATVIAEMTHIPAEIVTADEAQKLLNIETELKKMVIGQDGAVIQVGSALKRARAGIRNDSKPIASFLFVGTTGVGKTQTAKALAQCYFGDKKAMIRLDMSEYQQPDSINRLIGNPDGSTRGILTEAVRTKPFALILLDEIEKAHSNILLTFLQVLDDGRLTDSNGLTVDFTNTIIIATSNVGTRSIQEIFVQNGNFDDMKNAAMKDVRSSFAPEFLNRFSGIIVFNPLNKENVRDITKLMLQDIQKNVEDKGIKVTFSEELINELINRGYNPEWGARPLARTIEDTVENYLAIKILSKEFNQGDVVTLGKEVFNNNQQTN